MVVNLLFGEKFVENNKDNYKLLINREEIPLWSKVENSKEFLELKIIETKKITNMSYMFYYSTLVSIKLSYWNTKEVNNKKGMFHNSSYLTELPDEVANWDTSKVIDMSYMFFFCNKLIKLEIFPNGTLLMLIL